MTKKSALLTIGFIALLLLAACGSSAEMSDEDAINTIVAATLQANPLPEVSVDSASESSEGSISGNLSFPSEGIPPLNVVAFSTSGDDWYFVRTVLNQLTYIIEGLPAGSYTVVAYDVSSDYGGGYSQAVPCGLSVDCADHSLMTVEVLGGQETADINPGDWYAPPDSFPKNPKKELTTGSISGALSFPSEGIPPLNVVAFSTSSEAWYLVRTTLNQTSYIIKDLPAGSYTVVAFEADSDYGAGYSAAVPCGLSADCADHSLMSVEVIAGQETTGIDPSDWYAPPDAFPNNPNMEQSTGSISGSLIFPSNFMPAMHIVAFSSDTQFWYYVTTTDGQSFFQLDNLPTGNYSVVAYAIGDDEGAGYSAAVPCGLSVDCTDHSLLAVTVV